MPVDFPWHSNPNWRPTEVTQFIDHVNSGAGTLIVETDAGLGYLKALGNPDGPNALAKDLLGTHLASMMGLPTFDYAIIEISMIDELPFYNGGQAEPGPAFITRAELGTTWGKDKRLLNKIDNLDMIAGLVVIDTWLRNTDRYSLKPNRMNLDNVFLSRESSEEGKLSLRAMDFSHAIKYGGELTERVNSIEGVKDETIYGLFPEFRKKITRKSVRRFASILGELSRQEIENAVEIIPREWQLESGVRTSLIDYLVSRANFVAESIESRLFGPNQFAIDFGDGGES